MVVDDWRRYHRQEWQNSFSALVAGEGLEALSSKAPELAEPEPRRRKQRVTAVGDSLLREMAAPVCRPNMLPGEVRWGADVWDEVESVLSLVCALDFYSLLLTNSAARGGVEPVRLGYIAAGWVKDVDAQVVSPQYCWWEGRAWRVDGSCRSTTGCTAVAENRELAFVTMGYLLFED